MKQIQGPFPIPIECFRCVSFTDPTYSSTRHAHLVIITDAYNAQQCLSGVRAYQSPVMNTRSLAMTESNQGCNVDPYPVSVKRRNKNQFQIKGST